MYAEVRVKVDLEYVIQVREGSLGKHTEQELTGIFKGNPDRLASAVKAFYANNYFYNVDSVSETQTVQVTMY